MTIIEAVLLSVVAILAAWSGYAAAKWGTESSLDLAPWRGLGAEVQLAIQRDRHVGDAERLIRGWVMRGTSTRSIQGVVGCGLGR